MKSHLEPAAIAAAAVVVFPPISDRGKQTSKTTSNKLLAVELKS